MRIYFVLALRLKMNNRPPFGDSDWKKPTFRKERACLFSIHGIGKGAYFNENRARNRLFRVGNCTVARRSVTCHYKSTGRQSHGFRSKTKKGKRGSLTSDNAEEELQFCQVPSKARLNEPGSPGPLQSPKGTCRPAGQTGILLREGRAPSSALSQRESRR
jgi:hypothetical protein